jgi:hypothetical protein
MENEIFKALELAQAEFKSKLEEILKTFPEIEKSSANIKIDLFEVPISSMPEGSVRRSNSKQEWWLSYSADYFKPAMYSISRKFKMVFDDETETSKEKPAISPQS